MEHPIKMDDLGVPLFLETPIYILKLTANAPENGWLQYDPFLLAAFRPIFILRAVSFRECFCSFFLGGGDPFLILNLQSLESLAYTEIHPTYNKSK